MSTKQKLLQIFFSRSLLNEHRKSAQATSTSSWASTSSYYRNKEGKPVSRLLYNHNHGPLSEQDMGEERLEEQPKAAAQRRHNDTVNIIQRLPQQEPNLIEVLSEKERKAEQELAKAEEDRDLAQALVEIFEEYL